LIPSHDIQKQIVFRKSDGKVLQITKNMNDCFFTTHKYF